MLLGWMPEQWAEAKARHKRMTGEDLPADFDGLMQLRAWWRLHLWPDPGSVRLDGVKVEADTIWGFNAYNAGLNRLGI